MTAGEVQRADVFSVQMHGYVMIKGDDREGLFQRRFAFELYGPEIPRGAAFFQPLADVVMRDNRSLFLEKRIPAGVIKVVVSVHDEPEWFVGDALQSGLNFFCQGSELVVNNDNPILADG